MLSIRLVLIRFYFDLFCVYACSITICCLPPYLDARTKTQPVGLQRVSTNGNKPPVALPAAATTATPSPPPPSSRSLIHQSPDGGYVSLLRQAVSSLADADARGSAVRFNSLQRPLRRGGVASVSPRGDHQSLFRSMRTVSSSSSNGAADRAVGNYPSVVTRDRDRRNDNSAGKGAATEKNGARLLLDGPAARKNADRPLTTLTSTLPKPAPRTRVPSASVAAQPLAHHETYENLQQLLNVGADAATAVLGNHKVCNDARLSPRLVSHVNAQVPT